MAFLFNRCGLRLSNRQLRQLWSYHTFLRRFNPELNLTRVHNFDNMVLKLYADSIMPADLVALPSPLLDLGTGPGMPGIPLKIYRPELQILLAESRRKRAEFLAAVLEHLQLKGVRIVERKIDADFQEPVAGVITRAVETMAKTLERVKGCLVAGGQVLFMKGPHSEAELAEVAGRRPASFKLAFDRFYAIPHTRHQRRLVVFERLDQPVFAQKAEAMERYRVIKIESDRNSRFRDLKKLLSSRGIRKTGQALIAGARPVAETLENFPERCRAWLSPADRQPPPPGGPAGLIWYQLAERLFKTLDVHNTRSALLSLEVPAIRPWQPSEGFPEGCSLLIPFQDPENVGTVIRSASAFGVRQIILLAECAYPFHPKALRASGGAALAVRLRLGPALDDLPVDLPVIALSAEGADIRNAVFPRSFGLLVGLEGPGLPEAWRRTAWGIPIRPGTESLNAATAAGIALYEWSRQADEGFRGRPGSLHNGRMPKT